jgi:hypothetical protein
MNTQCHDELLLIVNDGPELAETNYFDSPRAHAGLIFGSWNASALRLFIPDNQRAALPEMRAALNVPVTQGFMTSWGRDALEIVFDDRSSSPFTLWIEMENVDRWLGEDSHGKPIEVRAYTRDGVAGTWPGLARLARALPCLKPIPAGKPTKRWKSARHGKRARK